MEYRPLKDAYGYVYGTEVDTSNGSPYDRGAADSYYGRPREPHYWPSGSYQGTMVPMDMMTVGEIDQYLHGYYWNEEYGDKKDWG
jgi:hypothetical protein